MNRRDEINESIALLEAERDAMPKPQVYIWAGPVVYRCGHQHWWLCCGEWKHADSGSAMRRNDLFAMAEPGPHEPGDTIIAVDSFEGLK